jgi:hypothetical protein
MTDAELRDYLERMDMPTEEAAELAGMDARRLRRAAAGELNDPADPTKSVVAPPVERLFWLIEHAPYVLEALLAWKRRDEMTERLDELAVALEAFAMEFADLSDDDLAPIVNGDDDDPEVDPAVARLLLALRSMRPLND